MIYNFKINHNDKVVNFSIESEKCEFKYGYCFLIFNIEGTYYGGLIDENFNIVIPFVGENNEEDFTFITVFEDNKAIYGIRNEIFYLVDLKNAKFEIKDGHMVPKDYIITFDAYDDIDGKLTIILWKGKYFIYDVIKKTFVSIPFDYMDKRDEHIIGNMYMAPEENAGTAVIVCKLSFDGKIDNNVKIWWTNTGYSNVWYSDDTFLKHDKLIKEVEKTYNILTGRIKCEKNIC